VYSRMLLEKCAENGRHHSWIHLTFGCLHHLSHEELDLLFLLAIVILAYLHRERKSERESRACCGWGWGCVCEAPI
jgi:hypothetical protein